MYTLNAGLAGQMAGSLAANPGGTAVATVGAHACRFVVPLVTHAIA